MISDVSIVRAVSDHVAGDLTDGHMVILHLKSGVYYGLNPVGARIWQWIQEPMPVHEIQSRLLAQFEVEAERCRREVVALLEALDSHGLIEVVPPAA
jgi:hypothetical protein